MSRNIPLFIAFRVFFNARFYYPVLGVLFLDLGLSLEQYALLNSVWAATILLFEIPSGALADLIGRKSMVVLAAALMVVEMSVFAFAPPGPWLFPLLILNRILSGTAEACASGADEALAYDSLAEENREARWRDVLTTLMRWSSAAFFVAMILGALAFDRHIAGQVLKFLGFDGAVPTTTRWPVFMTLATSLPALACALAMSEPGDARHEGHPIQGAIVNIVAGARFVFSDPRIRLLLLCAVLFDSLVRLFLTFASNYYRLIEIPEFVNGFLGSFYALLGFIAASLARRAAARFSATQVFVMVGILIFAGLCGLCLATPYWGVWVVLPIGLSMPLMQYFLSNYINAWTESGLRATVLSFRGMAINLGYGFAGLAFAAFTSALRASAPGLSENALFGKSLIALPVGFAVGSVLLLATARFHQRSGKT
ncbi:MAG: MFS transporter [Verrucomicrobiaceae bacterium]|nr:MAG: MFS transporter [Verrucomicrobiaceae bacterium]